MSLYTYVPGRSELLELMIDTVYGEIEFPDPAAGWRQRVEFLTRQRWQLFGRHPWLLDYNMNRLPLGPHVLDVEEAVYAAVAATGLTGTDVVAVTNLIGWQLVGAARAQIGDAAEERHTGTSSEAYWMSRVSFWTTHFDYSAIPDHGADLGGRRLRRRGRLRRRSRHRPAAGRHRGHRSSGNCCRRWSRSSKPVTQNHRARAGMGI